MSYQLVASHNKNKDYLEYYVVVCKKNIFLIVNYVAWVICSWHHFVYVKFVKLENTIVQC
jgi:hypothetical protein